MILRHLIGPSVICVAALLFPGISKTQENQSKGLLISTSLLRQTDLLDNYFQQEILDAAKNLVAASYGKWNGAQINGIYKHGALNIYTVRASRLPQDGLDITDEINITPESLSGGAHAIPDAQIILINTDAWKRLAAATYMTMSGQRPPLIQSLAQVGAPDVWTSRQSEWGTKKSGSDTTANLTNLLMQGGLAFVVAHEMGHLTIMQEGIQPRSSAQARFRLDEKTARQRDEAKACPEFFDRRERIQNISIEREADRRAAMLIGEQCRIGNQGDRRHEQYMLGGQWFFVAATADRLLDLGRVSDSPFIHGQLQRLLGPELYRQSIKNTPREDDQRMAFGVHVAFRGNHPPDIERIGRFVESLSRTPCGSSGFDTTDALAMERIRVQMCRQLLN